MVLAMAFRSKHLSSPALLLCSFVTFCIVTTNTGGYDMASNGRAESATQDTERGTQCLLHQADTPIYVWAVAARYYPAIFNFSQTNVDYIKAEIGPMIADRRLCDRGAHRDEGVDPLSWPQRGCRCLGQLASAHRESKLHPFGRRWNSCGF